MWLLKTDDLTLHCFFGSIPKYSILSHTWEAEEITHQEMLNPTDEVRRKAGYQKIHACAAESRKLGYSYTWVDTCCIDKSSSAELSEAINSMFSWYRDSEEVLAPANVKFYAADWTAMGTKKENVSILSKFLSIKSYFLKFANIEKANIATKMSWAAHRETTRLEDMAYCLMGLFDINIPLLYGKGSKAFLRLQEEIIKVDDGMSIFLWKASGDEHQTLRGPLARSPREFSHVSTDRAAWSGISSLGTPFAMTNKGLKLHAPLAPIDRLYDECVHDDRLKAELGSIIAQDGGFSKTLYVAALSPTTNSHQFGLLVRPLDASMKLFVRDYTQTVLDFHMAAFETKERATPAFEMTQFYFNQHTLRNLSQSHLDGTATQLPIRRLDLHSLEGVETIKSRRPLEMRGEGSLNADGRVTNRYPGHAFHTVKYCNTPDLLGWTGCSLMLRDATTDKVWGPLWVLCRICPAFLLRDSTVSCLILTGAIAKRLCSLEDATEIDDLLSAEHHVTRLEVKNTSGWVEQPFVYSDGDEDSNMSVRPRCSQYRQAANLMISACFVVRL
ncbi:hypothetical protein BN1723_015559 [Verticillium longisporum]|uniref:Heterokaryon incompatibility domain-containing protein n=1 Tax=Verticillium longisporum TaxID=100787 RepID=A0A0G4MZV1_VERLO|nr:hypothetical protein BN1723_015559 [Verticillium longisporum]